MSNEENLHIIENDKNVSALKNARDMKEKAEHEAELAERARQADAEEMAYQAREEYAKELNEEKVDLIRLKQGMIEDSDKVFGQQNEAKKYTVWQKISNWFYHSKWWLGGATICALIGGFLIYDYATRVIPDLGLMLLSANPSLYTSEERIRELFSQNCEDYNHDDQVFTEIVQIPVSEANFHSGSSATQTYNTQLTTQFMADMCMLVISDSEADTCIFGDSETDFEAVFVNLEALYPQYDFIDGCRVKLEHTAFAEKVGMEGDFHEGTYLALRRYDANEGAKTDFKEAYEQALPVLEKVLQQIAKSEPSAP